MEKTTVLSLLLTGSIILNVILWFLRDPMSAECYATSGFEAPTTISATQAQEYLEAYRQTLEPPQVITGGIITRSAFDEMMCREKCNAISYSFALDASRGTGPGDAGIFMIASGVNVTYDEAARRITSVNNIGSSYYITRHWCPPSCMPF